MSPDAGRRLVSGADGELAARLSGVELTAAPGVAYAARVEIVPPPADRLARQELEVRLRRAAVSAAPGRVNAVIPGGPDETLAIVRYLLEAGAVTGQVIRAATPPERPSP